MFAPSASTTASALPPRPPRGASQSACQVKRTEVGGGKANRPASTPFRLPSPSSMIGIIAVSFQERHAVYRRARHETNVTRDCCTRRAVMAAKCVRRPVGMRPPSIRHIGMALDGQVVSVVSSGRQGSRSRYPQGMLKHAGQQMPDKVARVAAAAAAVERGTDRMATSVPERWPNASTSCIYEGDRESWVQHGCIFTFQTCSSLGSALCTQPHLQHN